MIQLSNLPYGAVLKPFEGQQGIMVVENSTGDECIVAEFYDFFVNGENKVHEFAALFLQAVKMKGLLQRVITEWPAFDGDEEVSGADLVDWFAEFRRLAKSAVQDEVTTTNPAAKEQGRPSIESSAVKLPSGFAEDQPNYLVAFPDFGTLDVVLPDGFEDVSYRNDTCPSFAKALPNGDYLRLWIDYADRAKKEIRDLPRFSLGIYDHEMQHVKDLTSSDNLDEIVAFISDFSLRVTPFQFIRDASRMTREDLNEWYLQNVGYRLDSESPTASDDEVRLAVAEMMFYHSSGSEALWCSTDPLALLECVKTEDQRNEMGSHRYRCEWPEGYAGAKPEEVGISFFTPTRGYSSGEMWRVSMLQLDQSVSFSEGRCSHSVTRVK